MFGNRLKQVAQEHFGSLKNLSENSGINYTQLSNYVNGAKPGIDILMKLYNVGININWLLAEQGSMMIKDNFEQDDYDKIETISILLEELSRDLSKISTKYNTREQEQIKTKFQNSDEYEDFLKEQEAKKILPIADGSEPTNDIEFNDMQSDVEFDENADIKKMLDETNKKAKHDLRQGAAASDKSNKLIDLDNVEETEEDE